MTRTLFVATALAALVWTTPAGAFQVPMPRAGSLDLALLVDSTGSMGPALDELEAHFVRRAQRYAGHRDLRLSVNFYRDQGERYVVDAAPLSSDLSESRSRLASAVPSGGGDDPEALVPALEAVLGHDWRAEERILLIVTDAPAHQDPSGLIADAARRGIQVVVADVSEAGVPMLERAVAQVGRYRRSIAFEPMPEPRQLSCGVAASGHRRGAGWLLPTLAGVSALCVVLLFAWWRRYKKRRAALALLQAAMAPASSPWLEALEDVRRSRQPGDTSDLQ